MHSPREVLVQKICCAMYTARLRNCKAVEGHDGTHDCHSSERQQYFTDGFHKKPVMNAMQ
jgi:hypothetical protein